MEDLGPETKGREGAPPRAGETTSPTTHRDPNRPEGTEKNQSPNNREATRPGTGPQTRAPERPRGETGGPDTNRAGPPRRTGPRPTRRTKGGPKPPEGTTANPPRFTMVPPDINISLCTGLRYPVQPTTRAPRVEVDLVGSALPGGLQDTQGGDDRVGPTSPGAWWAASVRRLGCESRLPFCCRYAAAGGARQAKQPAWEGAGVTPIPAP